MTYRDNRRRGQKRSIPNERIRPLTKEWKEQLQQRRDSKLIDGRKHDFYPPSSERKKPRIFFRRKSDFEKEKDPVYLFGEKEVSQVTFPNERGVEYNLSKSLPTEPSIDRYEENIISRQLPINRNKPNQSLHHGKNLTPSSGRVIRPRITPRRKIIERFNERNRMHKSCGDIRPHDFYEKWKGYKPQGFDRHKLERENRFDKKDPTNRIYDNYSPTKKKKLNINDSIGEFERSLLHRKVFDPSDPSVERKYDKKDPYNRLYGIDERLLPSEPFDHKDRSPPPIGKFDRKDLKNRLYGLDEFPEQKSSPGGSVNPRTKNLYGQLCKIRPKKEEDDDYQKKCLKARLWGTQVRPKLPRRDRVDYFDKKLHNPPNVKESSQFRKRFGDYEWKKLYRIPMEKAPRTHFRRQPRRTLYDRDGLPDHVDTFRGLGEGVRSGDKGKKNINRQLYGLDMYDQLHAKDFIEYQEMMKKRLNQASLFDVPVRKPVSLTKKIGEYNPWKGNEFTSSFGFKNRSGKYFDAK